MVTKIVSFEPAPMLSECNRQFYEMGRQVVLNPCEWKGPHSCHLPKNDILCV